MLIARLKFTECYHNAILFTADAFRVVTSRIFKNFLLFYMDS